LPEPFKSFSAVFPIILKNGGMTTQILLHRRQNTGYQDGRWDLAASGHVEENETAQSALIRECKEEIGIAVKVEDITFAHLSHRLSKEKTYYDMYFIVDSYNGTPSIMEPNKCSELEWFPIDALPIDIIECRKQDIQNYLNKILYSEKFEI